ncbi:glycosyltransferase family 4 protein [Candidatus Omnitrophota bacterium]
MERRGNKRRKKILIISNSYPTVKHLYPGNIIKRQVENLRGRDHGTDYTVFFNPIFRFMTYPTFKTGLLWNIVKCTPFIVFFMPVLFKRYDIVHAHNSVMPGLLGAIYKMCHRIPFIITSHGSDIEAMKTNTLWRLLAQIVYDSSDKIITVGSPGKLDIIRYGAQPENKIDVISPGIDCGKFKPCGSKAAAKKVLGISDSVPLLLFVGYLTELKRPRVYLRALDMLKDQKIQAAIVGEGPLLNELMTYAERRGLRVLFFPLMPQDKLLKWYHAADIFVFPSSHEGQGLVGIEALASGTPVVASKVGGKVDWLRDGENGLFFKPDNIDELVEKIRTLLDNNVLYEKLRDNAVDSVKEFDAKNTETKIIAIYEKLAERLK